MIHDLPLDLEEMELEEPLALLVGKVRQEVVKGLQPARGKASAARRARFGIPASPASSRLRSADGLESFHFAINRTRERTAAGFDSYSTAKEDEEAPVMDRGEPGERPALAFDAYVLDHGGEEQDRFPTMLDPQGPIRQRQKGRPRHGLRDGASTRHRPGSSADAWQQAPCCRSDRP